MTPEELEETIRTGDLTRCMELIKSAPEKERRAAAPLAQKWQRAAWARRLNEAPVSGVDLPLDQTAFERIVETACAALAGTGTLSELKGLGYRVWHLGEPAWELLAHRNPEWLQEWADWVAGENAASWVYVRRLLLGGKIKTPTGDSYITAMIGHLWPKSALEFLRNDPQLLDHEVWRLFEVEGSGENSLAARDKYSSAKHTWSHALTTLAGEGKLCRGRLLDASLQALESDFSQFRVGWFAHFHEALLPSLEERAERVDHYLALLGSRIPPTVSFALKALAQLDKSNRVPGPALVGAVVPALAAREKGTVSLALKLLDRAAKREPALAAAVACVATEALLHEKPDVQSAALDLIERHGAAGETSLAELVRTRLDDLSPSQRPRAQGWLGNVGANEPASSFIPEDTSDLLDRAGAVPERWRKAAGVDLALTALREPEISPPIVDLTFGRFPVLDAAMALSPIETLDELIDVCAAVIENLGPPDEIERMLDGISRLCGERPPDFERRTGPLAKRAEKLASRWSHEGAGYLGWINLDLPKLVSDWLTGSKPQQGRHGVDLTWFQGRRLLEVAQRAAAGKSKALLATPTHGGGWLDPRVLVRRATQLQELGDPPSLVDTLQALLRLAPEHRTEALAAAVTLQGEYGDAIRYALGAEGIAFGPNIALWIAAARARNPQGDDAALDAHHPGLGPDAALVAHCRLSARRRIYEDRGKEFTYFIPDLEVVPNTPKKLDESQPTVMLHVRIELEGKDLEVRRWLATVWPAGREAWFAQGVRLLARNLDWAEAEWHNRVHLEALLEPDTSLGEMGLTLLGLGLAAKEPGESGLATDAAIIALRDGRLSGTLLGAVMGSLLEVGVDAVDPPQQTGNGKVKPASPKPGGMITGTRWAKTLAEVARASTLHAVAVHTALQGLLANHPSLRPADLAALLELLHELSVQLGASIDRPETRTYLEGQQGSGKGGKLAKSLLELRAQDQSHRRKEVARLALEGRIERAERWSAMAETADRS